MLGGVSENWAKEVWANCIMLVANARIRKEYLGFILTPKIENDDVFAFA